LQRASLRFNDLSNDHQILQIPGCVKIELFWLAFACRLDFYAVMSIDHSRSQGRESNIALEGERLRVDWSAVRRSASSRLEIVVGFCLREEPSRGLTEFADKNPELTLFAIPVPFAS
jgi:hypothetical protein